MTPELEALARRAVACKHWRWMTGMLTNHSAVVVAKDVFYHCRTGSLIIGSFDDGELPDLSDLATLGCLLALVREAYDAPELSVIAHWWYHCATWKVWKSCHPTFSECDPIASARTEAEAIVAALEAAP